MGISENDSPLERMERRNRFYEGGGFTNRGGSMATGYVTGKYKQQELDAQFDQNQIEREKIQATLAASAMNAADAKIPDLGPSPNLPDNSNTWNNAQTPNSGGAAAPGGLASLGVQRNGNAYSAAPGGLTTGLSGPSLMQQSNDAYNQRHGPASNFVSYGQTKPNFEPNFMAAQQGKFTTPQGFADSMGTNIWGSALGYLAGGEVEGPPGLDQVPAQLPNGAPARINDGEYILPRDHVINIAAKALGKKGAMLPEEKLHEIGIALLDAEVAQSTGQQPGARPMPPLPGQEGVVPGMAGADTPERAMARSALWNQVVNEGLPFQGMAEDIERARNPIDQRLPREITIQSLQERAARAQQAATQGVDRTVSRYQNMGGARSVVNLPEFMNSPPPSGKMPVPYRPAGLPALPWQGTSSPVNYAPAQLSGPGLRPMLPAPGDVPYRPAASGPAIPGGYEIGMDEMRANARHAVASDARRSAAKAGLKPAQDAARAGAQARFAAGEAASGASKAPGMLARGLKAATPMLTAAGGVVPHGGALLLAEFAKDPVWWAKETFGLYGNTDRPQKSTVSWSDEYSGAPAGRREALRDRTPPRPPFSPDGEVGLPAYDRAVETPGGIGGDVPIVSTTAADVHAQTPAHAAGVLPSGEEFYNIQNTKAQGQAQRNVIDADQRARAKAYYQSTGLNPSSVHPDDTAYMAGLQEAFSQRRPGTNYAGQIMQRSPFREAPAQQTQQADPIMQFHETVRRLGMASGLAPKDAYQYIAPRVLEAMQQQAPDPRMAQLQWEQQKFGAQQQFDWNKFVAEQTLAQQRAAAEQQGNQYRNVIKRQVPINPQNPLDGTTEELVYFAGVDPETGQPVYLSQGRQGQGNNPYAAADAKRRQQ